MMSSIPKKIILVFIISLLISGGFFYFFNQGFFNKSLFASLAKFFPLEQDQKENISLLKEELTELNQKISFLKEELREKSEDLEKLDDLREKLATLEEKISQLEALVKNFNQISFENLEKEGKGKTEEGLKEQTKDEKPQFSEEIAEEEKNICSVNINTASQTELQKIRGVGPVLAQRIIEARPFSSLFDLKRVKGIGDKTLETIIEQGCAYVDELYFGFSGSSISEMKAGPPPLPPPSPPAITLSFPQEVQANREIKVNFSVSNLKIARYDIKISIEKDGSLSQICQIFNQTGEDWQCPEGQWQSSFNYLTNVFEGTGFAGNFLLKLSEDKSDFRGETDIIARVRENGKTNHLAEFKGKINIVEPETENQEPVNLLLNPFFNEWNEPQDNVPHLLYWQYSGTSTHLSRDSQALVGSYSLSWTPITSANNLTQTNILITKPGTYYTQVWMKPLNVDETNYLRVALDIADPTTGEFPRANFTDYQRGGDWIKIINNRKIEIGEKGGIRIRVQRSGSEGPYLLIGAAWFGFQPPPENWPF